MKKFLISLTTAYNPLWREAIKDLDRYGIDEIACFPTKAELPERQEMYRLLSASKIKSIPHVHLRDDMGREELDFFRQKFGTQLFNIHPWPAFVDYLEKNQEYRDLFFVENLDVIEDDFEYYLERSSGLCLDFSHWHDFGKLLRHPSYHDFAQYHEKYPIGCAHISAIRATLDKQNNLLCHSAHILKDLSELDYMQEYLDYLPEYTSIELANPIKEQLEVKKYLEALTG
jgi:hypothetical protein